MKILKYIAVAGLVLVMLWVELVAFFATIFGKEYDIPDFKNTML